MCVYIQSPQIQITEPCKCGPFYARSACFSCFRHHYRFQSHPVKLQVNEKVIKEFLAMILKLIKEGSTLGQIFNFDKHLL